MATAAISDTLLSQLRSILPDEFTLTDDESLDHYSHDETEDLKFLPSVVVKPRTTGEVSAILKIASSENVPVTPRGAGTGLSGGCLPVHGGIVLSLERMNSILEIDKANLICVTEPGVITQVLQEAVEQAGLSIRSIPPAGQAA